MRSLFGIVIFLLVLGCGHAPDVDTYQRNWTEEDRTFLVENLQNSYQQVIQEISELDEASWNWKQDSTRWSIAEVVEHLIVQDELFYREIRVLTGLDKMMPQADSLFGADSIILSYREITPENTGRSPSYLEPMGRWCSKDGAITGYGEVRGRMINFAETTEKDLRKFYTGSGRGPTAYRDLHQLLLISIAHTERHLKQIKGIKEKAGF